MLLIANSFSNYFILISLLILGVLFLGLIIYAVSRRLILQNRSEKFKAAEEKVLPYLYDYLAGERKRAEIASILTNRFEIVIAFRNINLMIDNMEGKERDMLKSLLDIPDFKKYYLKKINSSYAPDVAQACIYFEKKNITDKKLVSRLRELQAHEFTILAYSSTLALINTTNQKIRDEALDTYLKRTANASMAINDILFKYSSTHPDQTAAAEKLYSYIDHDEIPPKTSAAIVKMLPELGYVHLSERLLQLLKKSPVHDENGIVQAALIDAMNHFSVPGVAEVLIEKETWKSAYKPVRLAAARWIEENYEPNMNYLLLNLANDQDLEIRIPAQLALTHASNYKKLESMISPKYRHEWMEMKRSAEIT